MKKKLLIFDADGTLWDSEMDIFQCFNDILKEETGLEIRYEKFQDLAGLSVDVMYECVLPEEKKNLSKELTQKYRKYYLEEHLLDTTVLFENVKNTLETLAKRGFHMAIASGKPKRALDKIVEAFDLKEFEFVLGTAESEFKSKPDPGIVNYILEKMNIAKEDAVMIGDTKTDILCGQNAEMDTISVTYGFEKKEKLELAKPTVMVDEFGKLLDVLELEE